MRSYNEQIITLTYSCTRFEWKEFRWRGEQCERERERRKGREGHSWACKRRTLHGASHARGRNQPDLGMWNCGSVVAFVSLRWQRMWPSNSRVAARSGLALYLRHNAGQSRSCRPCLGLSKVSCTCHKAHWNIVVRECWKAMEGWGAREAGAEAKAAAVNFALWTFNKAQPGEAAARISPFISLDAGAGSWSRRRLPLAAIAANMEICWTQSFCGALTASLNAWACCCCCWLPSVLVWLHPTPAPSARSLWRN